MEESDWTFHQVFGDRGEDVDFQDIAEGMCSGPERLLIALSWEYGSPIMLIVGFISQRWPGVIRCLV